MSSKKRPTLTAVQPVTAFAPDKPGDVRMETMLLTPEIAARWLHDYTYDGQRSVRRARVEAIKDLITRGLFGLSEVRICYVADDGYLTNGQHRLHAIVELGVPVQVIVVRRFCANLEEVANDYSTHDARFSNRTYGDIYQAHNLDDETGLTPPQVQKVASAAAFINADFQEYRATRVAEVRVALVRDWAQAAGAFFEAIAGASAGVKKKLSTAPVFAVALVTFRHSPDEAAVFWQRVAANDRLEPGTPEHSLLRWLDDNQITSSNYNRVVRISAAAWNASYEGRHLTLLKVVNPTAPVTIKGSPYR
jgi:hypothetical protein